MFPNNHNQYYANRFQQETNYYDDEALSEEANEKYYDFQHHHQRQYEENQNDYLTKSGKAAFCENFVLILTLVNFLRIYA
jgi:hypothetical protein